MTGVVVMGAVFAFCLAVGLWCIVRAVPTAWRVELDARIAPYLDPNATRDARSVLPRQGWSPSALWQRVSSRGATLIDTTLGGSDSVRQRLHQAGLSPDVESFRIQQVLWGISASVVAGVLSSLLWWTRGASVIPLAMLVACAALVGIIARDQALTRSAKARQQRILAEFPALAELLALAVTAGEGTAQALDRVSRLSNGELAKELEYSLGMARTGTPMQEALQGLSDRVQCAPLTRFIDGLIVAMQRGTPLGDVLRAQAQDVREAARQELIEAGGKREIAMMIPIVFLVLPVTVLFAVFPGLSMLRFTV